MAVPLAAHSREQRHRRRESPQHPADRQQKQQSAAAATRRLSSSYSTLPAWDRHPLACSGPEEHGAHPAPTPLLDALRRRKEVQRGARRVSRAGDDLEALVARVAQVAAAGGSSAEGHEKGGLRGAPSSAHDALLRAGAAMERLRQATAAASSCASSFSTAGDGEPLAPCTCGVGPRLLAGFFVESRQSDVRARGALPRSTHSMQLPYSAGAWVVTARQHHCHCLAILLHCVHPSALAD